MQLAGIVYNFCVDNLDLLKRALHVLDVGFQRVPRLGDSAFGGIRRPLIWSAAAVLECLRI